MEELEINARSVEEAIQRALDQLGVSREEVEVNVVKEGKHGVLGLGSEEATVRVKPLVSEVKATTGTAEMAKSIIEALIAKLGLDASVEYQQPLAALGSDDVNIPITFDIIGDDLGILIGRQGETLACFQYVVRLILAHQTKTWVPVIIDVEGYKERRYQSLQDLAERTATQVMGRRAPFTLKPMPAFERRIIHVTLADHPDVTTESTGVGESRRVCILPKGHSVD